MYWKRHFSILSLLLTLSFPLYAAYIFHWVDESGVHHFDQAAPSDVPIPVSTVEIQDDPPSDFDPEAAIQAGSCGCSSLPGGQACYFYPVSEI